VHILSEPAWTGPVEFRGQFKVRYCIDDSEGYLDPVHDFLLYEKHIPEAMIEHLKSMERDIKMTPDAIDHDGTEDESGSSLDGCMYEDDDSVAGEIKLIEPLLTASTRALQRRQHLDHDFLPSSLAERFRKVREVADVNLGRHLNEVLHNCSVAVRNQVKVPVNSASSIGKTCGVL
jgi:hypothetical protein